MSDTEFDVHAALRQRLRFEQACGIESLRPLALEKKAPASPASASIPVAKPGVQRALAPTGSAAAKPEAAPGASEVVAPSQAPQDSAEKAQRWAELEAQVKACTKCPLHAGRTQTVFGEGDRNARLVFVGEGPGETEDQTGRPFVGRAGELLDKIIGAMGLQRQQVYICNIVKCRPPGNRTPELTEVATCTPYLEAQLELIGPKAIVALGAPASKYLLKTNTGIMALRGRWGTYRGIKVMPTYHPAFLLRQYTDANRRAVWDDMQQVLGYLKENS